MPFQYRDSSMQLVQQKFKQLTIKTTILQHCSGAYQVIRTQCTRAVTSKVNERLWLQKHARNLLSISLMAYQKYIFTKHLWNFFAIVQQTQEKRALISMGLHLVMPKTAYFPTPSPGSHRNSKASFSLFIQKQLWCHMHPANTKPYLSATSILDSCFSLMCLSAHLNLRFAHSSKHEYYNCTFSYGHLDIFRPNLTYHHPCQYK